jgi:hypothetical protein
MRMVDKRSAHLIGSPGVFLPRLPQHPACGGPHGARPSDWKGLQHDDRVVLQSWLRHTAPRPFHPVGYSTSVSGARLALCRRFGPSPCPVHYGERLATTPSADFCPLTHDVDAARATRITVGAGGLSSAFARGLSLAPVATTARLGFDGDSCRRRVVTMPIRLTPNDFTSGHFQPAIGSRPTLAGRSGDI